eukprot:13877529-Alexandrium_andersonii.AAC.1
MSRRAAAAASAARALVREGATVAPAQVPLAEESRCSARSAGVGTWAMRAPSSPASASVPSADRAAGRGPRA